MSFYDVSELIIKEQIEQLVNVTIDPSTIPITQQQELLTKFDDLLEKYPLTLSLWQRYFNLYIYNLQHGSNLNENSTTQSGEIIDEKLNAKFTKAIQILKPNNFQIYDILLKYQLKNVNYVTGGKQALQSIIEQFVKIWDKSLSLNPFSTDHFQYIMTFVDLFQHWQVVNNDDLIIRNNTIRKHIIHFVSSSFYKDLEKVWKWFVNWDSNNAGSGEYKINQVSPIYMKMRSKYMQWESFYNSLANLNDFDRMTQCLNWETQHKQDYENLKIYQSRYKFIIQRFFHSKQFESEYVWDLLIHNSSNSGEYNQLFLYEKALQYMPRSLNLALRYSQALELKQGKQQSTIDTVDKMFKLLIDNTKKDQDLVSISGNFDNSLNAQLSIIFKKMLQENTRLKGVKGLRQAFKTFREFIKTEKCLLNYDIFITNCKYELQADARNMPICIKILSLGLNQYGKDNIENLNKYMLTTLNFVTEAGFTREHIKSYFETYKQSLNNNIKELCRENTGKTSGEVTIDKIPLELRKNILKVYKPWISYESGMNMGKYLNVESIYSEILKTIPGITPVEIWELYSSQNSAEELLPKQEISNAVLPNIIKQQPQIILPNNLNMMEPVSVSMPDTITEHVELPAELFEVLLNLPKADTFKPMFDDAQLQSLATDMFGIMRDMNIEKFTYKE